ncbi:unannotated protein [freshwater metagenome]|uniref:Unannotated protein n=1 Tax=freshwater metagenome TaxID=449393 RepID=A0A6J6YRT9_9ZZZZ
MGPLATEPGKCFCAPEAAAELHWRVDRTDRTSRGDRTDRTSRGDWCDRSDWGDWCDRSDWCDWCDWCDWVRRARSDGYDWPDR